MTTENQEKKYEPTMVCVLKPDYVVETNYIHATLEDAGTMIVGAIQAFMEGIKAQGKDEKKAKDILIMSIANMLSNYGKEESEEE